LYEGLALLFFVDPEAAGWGEQVETSVRLLLKGLQQGEVEREKGSTAL
jgi:hypothetical protein